MPIRSRQTRESPTETFSFSLLVHSASRVLSSYFSFRRLHSNLHLLPHAVGKLLNLVGLANDREREGVQGGFVYFNSEVGGQLQKFGAVQGDLVFWFSMGCAGLLLFNLLVARFLLMAGVGLLVGL